MENAVEIKNLSKEYYYFEKDYKRVPWIFTKKGYTQIKPVLKDISFSVKKGEVLGIIGRNGAGKSTLMKIIAGITFCTEGEMLIEGKVGALINLSAGFNSELSGRENIYYKATLLGMSVAEIDQIIDDIEEFVDIGEYFDEPIRTYSSGMAVRVGFALATFTNPDVLIIDEVFAVGDIDFKEKSKKKTTELFRSGKSIIFSSHTENQIREFCTRVLYIDDGMIKFLGDVEEGLAMYNEDVKHYRQRKRSGKNKAHRPFGGHKNKTMKEN